jgi:hypothetical protein
MKKLITILVLLMCTASAMAQSTAIEVKKSIVCDDTKKIYNELVNGEYAESPAWGGEADKTKFILLINKTTGTWTLIEFNKNLSCILGVGEGSHIMDFEKKKQSL